LELEKVIAAVKLMLVAGAKKAVVNDSADYIIFDGAEMLSCAETLNQGFAKGEIIGYLNIGLEIDSKIAAK
jgi:hypothetical protein